MLHGGRLYTQWAEGQVTAAQRATGRGAAAGPRRRVRRRHQPAAPDGTGVGRDWPPASARRSRCTTSPTCRWTSACAATPSGPSRRAGRRARRSGGCTSATWQGRTPAAAGARTSRRAGRPSSTTRRRSAAGDRAGRHRRHGRADGRPQPVRLGPGRRGRAEPGGDRGGPGHARGRERDRLLHRPRRVPRRAETERVAGPSRRRAVRRTLHAAASATAAATRWSSRRSSSRRSATASGSSASSTTGNRWYGCGERWA